MHAEISGTNPYNLLASNGGPSDALGEDAKKPEKFKPKREYKAPTLFVSLAPGVPNKSTVKLHKRNRRGNSVEAPCMTYRIGGEIAMMMVGIIA